MQYEGSNPSHCEFSRGDKLETPLPSLSNAILQGHSELLLPHEALLHGWTLVELIISKLALVNSCVQPLWTY